MQIILSKIQEFTSFTFQVPDTNDVTVLAPGPTLRNEKTTKRKASSSGKVDALPMEDRLRLLSHDGEAAKTTPPRTDSLLQLLLQGLHNKDPKILASVLDRADESLIENTVRKLPIEAIVPLVQELQHYIKVRVGSNIGFRSIVRPRD